MYLPIVGVPRGGGRHTADSGHGWYPVLRNTPQSMTTFSGPSMTHADSTSDPREEIFIQLSLN